MKADTESMYITTMFFSNTGNFVRVLKKAMPGRGKEARTAAFPFLTPFMRLHKHRSMESTKVHVIHQEIKETMAEQEMEKELNMEAEWTTVRKSESYEEGDEHKEVLVPSQLVGGVG